MAGSSGLRTRQPKSECMARRSSPSLALIAGVQADKHTIFGGGSDRLERPSPEQ
jgi:hypothetical protein